MTDLSRHHDEVDRLCRELSLPSQDAKLAAIATGTTPGRSTDFLAVRPYERGDPIRQIDWRAAARSENTEIRVTAAPTGQRILFRLDASFAMRRPAARGAKGKFTKFDRARHLCEVIAGSVVRRGGLCLIDCGNASESCPSEIAIRNVLDELHRSVSGPRDVTARRVDGLPDSDAAVVLSDFLAEPDVVDSQFFGTLAATTTVVQVLDRDEIDLPDRSSVRFVSGDNETIVETVATVRAAYSKQLDARMQRLRERCRDDALLRYVTESDPLTTLSEWIDGGSLFEAAG